MPVGGQHDFGIATRAKSMADRFEPLTQLDIVVDFAIVDEDGLAVVGKPRLRPGVEIADGETSVCEGHVTRFQQPAIVRSPHPHQVAHRFQAMCLHIGRLSRLGNHSQIPHTSLPAPRQCLVIRCVRSIAIRADAPLCIDLARIAPGAHVLNRHVG